MIWQRLSAGAVAGFMAAFAVDYHAFLAWQSYSQAVRYDWKTAVFRWTMGALLGAIGSAGVLHD